MAGPAKIKKKGNSGVVESSGGNIGSIAQELRKTYKTLEEPEFIKTGSPIMDALLGGGLPVGKMIMCSSDSGLGKTTTLLHICKAAIAQGKSVLYIDAEGGVNESQLEGIGLLEHLNSDDNPDGKFVMFQISQFADIEYILNQLIASVDLIGLDSITSMLPKKLADASVEETTVGVHARLVSLFLQKYKGVSTRYNTTWFILNQTRTNISFVNGGGEIEAGGKAQKFYPDIRLIMKKAYPNGDLTRDEETANGIEKVVYGSRAEIWAKKNRFARPDIKLVLPIEFGKGINNNITYYDFLEYNGIITKSGGWYYINFQDGTPVVKKQGQERVFEWIGEAENRDKVKNFIKKMGGIKLIRDMAVPVEEEEDTDGDVIEYVEPELD